TCDHVGADRADGVENRSAVSPLHKIGIVLGLGQLLGVNRQPTGDGPPANHGSQGHEKSQKHTTTTLRLAEDLSYRQWTSGGLAGRSLVFFGRSVGRCPALLADGLQPTLRFIDGTTNVEGEKCGN